MRGRFMLVLAVVGALATVAVAAAITGRAEASPPDVVQAAKAASARYHSVEQALQDGYSGAGEPCVASPGGAMGFHYVNRALIADGVIDPERPEVLLYVPDENGTLKLAGVEYMKVDADQNLATDGDRPSVFDQAFDGPMPGHNPTMPVHYDLHVWFWKSNPSGLFAQFNPSVGC